AGFAVRVAAALAADDRPASPPPLLAGLRSGPLPLSFAQERLWFLDQLAPGGWAYNIPAALRLRGRLDIQAMERALVEIVRRHEALRTVFVESGGKPVQVVTAMPEAMASAMAAVMPRIDLSALAGSGAESLRLAREESCRSFDLGAGPLLRTVLVGLGAEEHLLLLTVHHIVADGWSVGVFWRELESLYVAFAAGRRSPLVELPLQYVDFAIWQREWLTGEVLAAQIGFWRARLEGAPRALPLPTDRPRPPVQSFRGAAERVLWSGEEGTRLRRMGRAEGATLFMTFMAAWATLLHRMTGEEVLVIGSPVAGRSRPQVEGLIGLFVNTLPLHVDLAGELSWRGLLGRIREETLAAFAHQEVPFERLVESLSPVRDLSRSPLFQVMLVLQDDRRAEPRLAGLEAELVPASSGTSKFDLTLTVSPEASEIAGELEYSTDLFEAPTARRLLGYLRTLLAAAVASPEREIGDLALLGEAERQQLLVEWNETSVERPEEVCLHELFFAQAARTPDHPAVIFEGRALSYHELAARSARLAGRLVGIGVGPEIVVGVFVERSIEMMIALLAVLEAGGAYLPIDPDYPTDRISYLLEDSAVPVLLVQHHLRDRLPDHRAVEVSLSGVEEVPATRRERPLGSRAVPANLAYVIYTSGSTGRPKGTMNTHQGIVNRLLWMQEQYGLSAGDRVLQKTPLSFDVSVWELFWPLLAGAQLVVARPGGHQDPGYLVETIVAEEITTLHFVPSMLQLFIEARGVENCRSLDRVICSGEALPANLVQRFEARLGELGAGLGVGLHNLYGPTEAAVDVTSWACGGKEDRTSVPIGRPVANTQVRLLDRNLATVPIGVAGELHIGGVQLARGYLLRPELTAEKFIPDPFAAVPGSRLYKTGDLARYRPTGAIEFLGRIDHQVKVRGLRIELGEIECALVGHSAVREAVVLARADGASVGDVWLEAYVTMPAGEEAPSLAELRTFLSRHLPESMLPSTLHLIAALPLTPSGKVDRKALAQMALARTASPGGERVAPCNDLERTVARVWSEVLKISEIGVHDNFFELGGHSLLATQVLSRLQETLGTQLPLRALFEAPTVAGLVNAIESSRGLVLLWPNGGILVPPPLERVPHQGNHCLSAAQQRMWFAAQLQEDSWALNSTTPLRLRGLLDPAALNRAMNELAARHEALRTSFHLFAGEPVQVIDESVDLPLPVVDLQALPGNRREGETRRITLAEGRQPFDLTRAPLFRVRLLRLGPDDQLLIAALHHIITDEWSMKLLTR
ncbi:MAG TPA: amino acid adenylation domain-containing protein, partial [Thermoanaerobaculia bacterium]|nr:amino acid adenylation domain-containing protein [Thermoanaerobaculia bacterium]